MNEEHYQRVKRVLAKSEIILAGLIDRFESRSDSEGKLGRAEVLKSALIELGNPCSELWGEEFPEGREFWKGFRLDLSGANLSGGLFAGWNETMVPLNGADF